jgi:hypothetical protein
MLARANLTLGLVSGQDQNLGRGLNPKALAARYGFDRPEAAARFLMDLLLPGPLEPQVRDPILKAAATGIDSDLAVREAARRILTLPEYQLA